MLYRVYRLVKMIVFKAFRTFMNLMFPSENIQESKSREFYEAIFN
jgi:hypothetical protein